MVRTRYAPSPTGYMHIGNIRAALNEYLLARSLKGTFVLRIEDTDQKREVEGAVQLVYDTLASVGIDHDEGPDVGGPYGPYIQSQRKNNYMEYAKELIEKKKAYYCFCSKERLETLTKEGTADAVKYDRHCLSLSREEIAEKLEHNEPFVIRQLIPEGKTTFKDELYGEITVDNSELDDQILIKSDGFPTYNFANVIDDNSMKITHVIRGSEYLSSTPKYNLLYEAFGWDIPVYIHVATILGENGQKLGKRTGAVPVLKLIEDGYLPEALLNFTALLGWSPSSNQEIFTKEELIEAFDVKGLSKSPSICDMTKLAWMNGEYFKKMDFNKFYEMSEPVIKEALGSALSQNHKKIAAMVQTRISFIKEIPEMIGFFKELPSYSLNLYENKKQKTDAASSLASLEKTVPLLEGTEPLSWNNDFLYNALQQLAKDNGLKNSQILWPVRTALSGRQTTPCGATELLEIFGKEESLVRIKTGIEMIKKAN